MFINSKPILFSAVQPSGELTIGNYIGTMRHWSNMQNTYECLYCIADLHALTAINKKKKIKNVILDTLALYLACGVDPNKSTIFVQSHVCQHSQLNWILSCCSRFGELSRMTQFKLKKVQNCIENSNIGLFNYPVLMASDILLYQTNFVPVGKDQKQHLELTCKIANRFNFLHGNVFTIPKPIISENGSKIMSLLDPTKKMSKSDVNQNNVIFLLENISSVVFKIKNCITDSEHPPKIYHNTNKKLGISNLLEILSAITNKEINFLEQELHGILYSEFKSIVAEALSKFLLKLQKSYIHYRNNEFFLQEIIEIGAVRARLKSQETLNKVFSAIGMV
ncbi:tryptophan--tRNA ligase [Buchnera aphidicola (Aphis glycines)]|uniref:Tryptophan--tRNA ligase n=1 Tax=Buchnera aphidicola (Aphis glycines) TaxID=1265350 RepID=A0A0M4HEL6_9GAMM|nr:tryptophan--tRNA ligase [Buchnera aphidicola]ALD15461.1 tryptophan--tRNA ligase [Buchnera aphidicola (Aphis glycines)]